MLKCKIKRVQGILKLVEKIDKYQIKSWFPVKTFLSRQKFG